MQIRITGAGTVIHDGKEYRRGDEIPEITIAHAARLVELGCAEYIAPDPLVEPESDPPENYSRPEPVAPVELEPEPEPEVDTETETEPESTPNYTRPRRGRRKRNA